MKLIAHWKRCLLHAWSSRLLILGFAFEALLQLWSMVTPETRSLIPEPWGHVLSLVCFGGAFLTRFVHQPKLAPEPEGARQE